MEAFDEIVDIALKDYPMYDKICEYKIDGLQNIEIQEKIQEEFGIKHSVEYISSLWRNKIPKIIASAAEDKLLDWYYLEVEKGKYKNLLMSITDSTNEIVRTILDFQNQE